MGMKELINGPGKPGDCEETIQYAQDIPERLALLLEECGCNVRGEILNSSGSRPDSYNLEETIVLEGVPRRRQKDVKDRIYSEIGALNVEFMPLEKGDRIDPYQRKISEYV
jgi:hypothetical protein